MTAHDFRIIRKLCAVIDRAYSSTAMLHKSVPHSAREFFPAKLNLNAIRRAASGCKGCDLWKNATQTVFGEGKNSAKVVLVGEQPGNEEVFSAANHSWVRPGVCWIAHWWRRDCRRSGSVHECRQTFQVGAARQTTHSQETCRKKSRARDCGMPTAVNASFAARLPLEIFFFFLRTSFSWCCSGPGGAAACPGRLVCGTAGAGWDIGDSRIVGTGGWVAEWRPDLTVPLVSCPGLGSGWVRAGGTPKPASRAGQDSCCSVVDMNNSDTHSPVVTTPPSVRLEKLRDVLDAYSNTSPCPAHLVRFVL